MSENRARARASAPLLDARQLALRIADRALWTGLDLQLFAGDSLAVTGPSGSGKTLLLRTLACLEPLASGNITLCSKSISEWFLPAYRARIVYVPQRPAFREGTVQSAIEAPFRLRIRRGAPSPIEKTREHLTALGRSDALLSQRTEHLSGGESQLVALLRALAVDPCIVMLDEPTASLDADTAGLVEALMSIWLGGGEARASIWTSHDVDQIARVCDRRISVGVCDET